MYMSQVRDDDYYKALRLQASATTTSMGQTTYEFDENDDGTVSTGTCSFSGSSGDGYASGFSGSNLWTQVWAGAGSPRIYCSCDANWGDATSSHYANVLTNGTVSYKATVKSVTESDGKLYITFDIVFTNDNYNARTWTPNTEEYHWSITKTYNDGMYTYTAKVNTTTFPSSSVNSTGEGAAGNAIISAIKGEITDKVYSISYSVQVTLLISLVLQVIQKLMDQKHYLLEQV